MHQAEIVPSSCIASKSQALPKFVPFPPSTVILQAGETVVFIVPRVTLHGSQSLYFFFLCFLYPPL